MNVHVRVTDEATGKPTPVRLRFAGPDGMYYPPLGRPAEFPVSRNEDVGGHVYLNQKRYAYIDGGCEIPLPHGVPLDVEITKGPAYFPIRRAVTVGEGQLSLRFAVRRWAAESWAFSAADSRCHFLTPHAADLEAAAEGLDFVNLLATPVDYPSEDGHRYRPIPNITAFSGQQPALANHSRGVVVNTFNVHPALGRLGLLNSHRAVYPLTFGHADETDDWALSDWCGQCHRKKGLVVWCDAYRPDAGLPGGEALVNAVLGNVDAIELDARDRATAFLPMWYRLLNAGIRLPLVGGSTKESNRVPLGGTRTLSPPADAYPDWVEHVRAGRTVVTTGPLLRFDGRSAEAASAVPFERLEIVADGRVIASAAPTSGDVTTASVSVERPPTGWIAARCVGVVNADLYPHVPVFAHTSPVFLGDARQPAAVAAVRRDVEGVRDWVESAGRFAVPKRREALLGLCEAALAKL
ncbi:MAG TPA: hypothetical protein VM597_37700 [Gemmataceae bacterium]|nr:hypothetical protein [Gemmataceae bacterium]